MQTRTQMLGPLLQKRPVGVPNQPDSYGEGFWVPGLEGMLISFFKSHVWLVKHIGTRDTQFTKELSNHMIWSILSVSHGLPLYNLNMLSDELTKLCWKQMVARWASAEALLNQKLAVKEEQLAKESRERRVLSKMVNQDTQQLIQQVAELEFMVQELTRKNQNLQSELLIAYRKIKSVPPPPKLAEKSAQTEDSALRNASSGQGFQTETADNQWPAEWRRKKLVEQLAPPIPFDRDIMEPSQGMSFAREKSLTFRPADTYVQEVS